MSWTTITSGQYQAGSGEKWTARLEKNEKNKYRIDFWVAGPGGKRVRKRKTVKVTSDQSAVAFFEKALTELLHQEMG